MPVLYNVPVRWAAVLKPDTQFDADGRYSVEVGLTKEQGAQLKEEASAVHKKGIKLKVDEDGSLWFRFNRKVKRADGGTNPPPVLKGPDGQPFDKLVGNGSVCNVQYSFAAYDNKFGQGVVSDLKGVKVISHVPYGEQDGEGLDGDEPTTKSSNEYDDDL